jgi:hypothetical protein
MAGTLSLDDLTGLVCEQLGLLDGNNKGICANRINARYRMIANAFPWRDLEITETVGLDAGSNVVPMPENMIRVINIRAGEDTFLDHVTPSLLLQTDPKIFERTGQPTVYYENYSSGNQIVLFPTPPDPVSLFIVGIRKLVPLVGGAVSIIRNIDNVLIAYATGDMLRKLRHYEKAELLYKEAGALLAEAQSLEKDQSNKVRTSKQLTVSGNSLAELTDSVCARTGQWGMDSIILIKEFLRRHYQRVCDVCNWSELTVIAKVNPDGSEIILPVYFDRIMSIRANANLGQIPVVEQSLWFGIAPQIFEQSGTALPASSWGYLTSVGVKFLPPTREKLSLYSSFGTDNATVHIVGEIRGEEASEDVTLQGSLPVSTVNEYDTPLTIAKSITKGDLIVTGQTSGAELVRILASERERRHMRIWLQPTPGTVSVALILGKRKIKPLVSDEDTPLLRDIQAVLISAASGDMFAKLEKDKAATDARAEAEASLQALIALETQQGAYNACVVPDVDYYGAGYDSWTEDWLTAKI